MIVIGADTHKRSHTVAAVEAASGRMLVERTLPAQRRCFEALLTWARGSGSASEAPEPLKMAPPVPTCLFERSRTSVYPLRAEAELVGHLGRWLAVRWMR
jgi:hypothetical protein